MSKKTIDFDKIFIKNEREKDKEEKEHEDIVVKAILEGRNKEMFIRLKEKYNLKYNIEVLHFILKKIYDLEFDKGTE